MGKFKEQKKQAIEVGKERGDAAVAQGEQRVAELRSVKGMLDNIYNSTDDEDTKNQIKMLEQQYREAGREAHEREVDDVVRSSNEELERNKADIIEERAKTETGIDRINDMKGVTDLARGEARSTEGGLQDSVEDFRNMEKTTEAIESDHENKSQNVRYKIESIFG